MTVGNVELVAPAFLVKLGPDGQILGAKSYGLPGKAGFSSIRAGPGDAIYVAGHFHQMVDFGVASLAGSGFANAMFVKFDSQGLHEWSRALTSDNSVEGLSIAPTQNGIVATAGYFMGSTLNCGDQMMENTNPYPTEECFLCVFGE